MNRSQLFYATLVTLLALPLAAAPPVVTSIPEGTPAAVTNATQAGTNVSTEADANEVQNVFTKPTLKSVADAVKAAQSGVPEAAAKEFMDMMGWDVRTQRGINDFFKNSLTFTMNVVRRGNSPNVKRMIELARANPYEMKEGEHVIVYYPKTISAMVGGTPVRKAFDEICPVDQLVGAADQAFTQTADALLFSPFLYWGQKARAKIFLIADPASWTMMQRGGARPAGTVVTEADYRELYVHVTPLTTPFLDQAVAFAISEQVINEYSMIVSGKSKSQAPLFFTLGLAGDISGLSSVLTEQGPQQVRRYGTREISPKDILLLRKRVEDGKATTEQLPLQASRLIPIARLLDATSYPSGAEDVYYLMRQDVALIKYLRQNGVLAFLALARDLADGRAMDRAFDNSYAKLRADISGNPSVSKEDKRAPRVKNDDKKGAKDRRAKEKESTDAYTPDDVLKKVKELRARAKTAIFFPLTDEYLQEQARDAPKK